MLRKSENILHNIRMYIKVRDYMANTPALDYLYHRMALDLVIAKLDALEKEYRLSTPSERFSFHWTDVKV